MHLADFQGLLAAVLPDLTLDGTLSVPHLTVQGPVTNMAPSPLRLGGTLAVEGLHISAPSLGIRLTKLDGTLTDLRGTLTASQPQELSGSLELRLHQVDVVPLALRTVRTTVAFVVESGVVETPLSQTRCPWTTPTSSRR